MNFETVTVPGSALQKLLGAASGDAALVYLYIKAGNDPESASTDLNLSDARFGCALATLRQLGLYAEARPQRILPESRPSYTEQDVMQADRSFEVLCEEVQRILGYPIYIEERKILLGFVRYLGMRDDVILVLVSYCRERTRLRNAGKGHVRKLSFRALEKEAYYWAEQGIDTMEEAAAFIQARNVRESRMNRLQELLQIRGRKLTAAEEKYAAAWLEMGFQEDAISMAYERTCLNTGGLNWKYMNTILQRWHEAGLHTAQAVRNGDRKPGSAPGGQRQLDAEERAAIERMLSEV